MGLTTFARGVSIFWIEGRAPEMPRTRKEWWFVGPLVLTSLLWAALPVLVFPTASEGERYAIAVIVAGMAGGAATVRIAVTADIEHGARVLAEGGVQVPTGARALPRPRRR